MMQQMLLGQGPSGVSIDDVFSIDLYTGTNAPNNTITNGIDLSGEGGLIWFKVRQNARNHALIDTARGRASLQKTNQAVGHMTGANANMSVTSFNSDGFTLGYNYQYENYTETTVAWTFRQAPKFFNMVKYTGNGSTRSIPHGLGTQPGLVIIKRYDGNGSWIVWHKEQYESNTPGSNRFFMFNTSAAGAYGVVTGVDATNVNVINNLTTNTNGYGYIMYVFAADTDNLIKTGIYTGNGFTGGRTIDVGFQPQWLMLKSSHLTTDWLIVDSARGSSKKLFPNQPYAENSQGGWINGFTSNGFTVGGNNATNASGSQYAYMAIAAP